MENDFGILRCLVGAKIMVNENHFRFDHKTFFNFWKTIYSFKNRKSFSEIKLSVLAHMFNIQLLESGNGRSSESRRHRNPATSGHRRQMPADQIPAESGRNPAMVKSFGQIWPDLDGSGH
jgi:hypothetical protein